MRNHGNCAGRDERRMTKIECIPFKPEHILEIKVHPIVETFRNGADILTWARMKEKYGVAASLSAILPQGASKIAACGGFAIVNTGTAEIWLTLDINCCHMPALPIMIRKMANEWFEEYKLDRMQTIVPAEWDLGVRFAEWIGMQREGLMRSFGPDRMDHILLARVRSWPK